LPKLITIPAPSPASPAAFNAPSERRQKFVPETALNFELVVFARVAAGVPDLVRGVVGAVHAARPSSTSCSAVELASSPSSSDESTSASLAGALGEKRLVLSRPVLLFLTLVDRGTSSSSTSTGAKYRAGLAFFVVLRRLEGPASELDSSSEEIIDGVLVAGAEAVGALDWAIGLDDTAEAWAACAALLAASADILLDNCVCGFQRIYNLAGNSVGYRIGTPHDVYI
jgi:hypothetical protein